MTNKVQVRMYRAGTGDCFALKFYDGNKVVLRMMIDAGCISGGKDHHEPYIRNLKKYLGDDIDVLVVTHEHYDHISMFKSCKHLFSSGFNVKEIWLGWTENDDKHQVKIWKTKYGQKKKALAAAAIKLAESLESDKKLKINTKIDHGEQILGAKENFVSGMDEMLSLYGMGVKKKVYVGQQAGMKVVKETIAKPTTRIRYFEPGEIIKNPCDSVGLTFYVLGPPKLYEAVKTESGKKGEGYEHNKEIEESELFSLAFGDNGELNENGIQPFGMQYVSKKENSVTSENYKNEDNTWRKIDSDWLMAGGPLALRMNSLTNNLSLVLAMELEETKEVLLFPGDAEYGSWRSWHQIDWPSNLGEQPSNGDKKKHFTEDLLNRTIFYKVAHHTSHNGTAKRKGLDMMIDDRLVAMATLDYDRISKHWKNTMPNEQILSELLQKTKGRLMVMNEDSVKFGKDRQLSLKDEVQKAKRKMSGKEEKEFHDDLEVDDLYIQYNVRTKK